MRSGETVSVVIPTRDRLPWLQRALEGALGQTAPEVREIVVVCDAATDQSADWLRSQGEPRLRALTLAEQVGPAQARNIGVETATGQWVAFLDDDDLWAPDKVSRQLQALRMAGDAGWSCTGSVHIDRALRILGAQFPPPSQASESLARGNSISGSTSSVMARRSLFLAEGGFDSAFTAIAEDWDLWIRMARRSALASVDHPLVGITVHPGNRSRAPFDADRELLRLTAKHAAVWASTGIEFDESAWTNLVAELELRAGRRKHAVRRLVRSAVTHRAVMPALKAVAAMLPWPSHVAQLRRRRRVPDNWRREADAWLEPIGRTHPMTESGGVLR